jgi:hypothetical protein
MLPTNTNGEHCLWPFYKKMHISQPLPPEPLPPEKHTFFSQFHLKNARFLAIST